MCTKSSDDLSCPSKKPTQTSKIAETQEKKKLLWSVLIIDSAVSANIGVPKVRE